MAVDDSYTKALLHMDGTDASTTFTDESGKTWTAYGNAQIDTAQSKFGGASGLFDGTGDYIDTPDHADFDVGSGDFTVDFWVKRNATGRMQLCGQLSSGAANGAIQVEFNIDDKLKAALYYNAGASAATNTYGTALTDTASFHHIAVIRYGNTLYTAVDGTLSAGTSVTGITVDDVATKFAIGRVGEWDSVYFNGWVDEFRFSKGIARWTANFTPPTSAYAAVVTVTTTIGESTSEGIAATLTGIMATTIGEATSEGIAPTPTGAVVSTIGEATSEGLAPTLAGAVVGTVGEATAEGISPTLVFMAVTGEATAEGFTPTLAGTVVSTVGEATSEGIAATLLGTVLHTIGTAIASGLAAILYRVADKPSTTWTESSRPSTTWTEG